MAPIKRVLVSVYNKTGIVGFISRLKSKFDVEILSTGGTASLLEKNGIPIIRVEEYTGSPEMFDGRVKTLHPKIEGGILMRNIRKDIEDAEKYGIPPIDMVVCNLYPFTDALKDTSRSHEDMLEMIDIGGPTMIRAAAKNYKRVTVITDPGEYDEILEIMEKNGGEVPENIRLKLAVKVFEKMALYDAAVARYLGDYLSKEEEEDGKNRLPSIYIAAFEKIMDCRYGENWDQRAAFYRSVGARTGLFDFEQLHGKELSFNNLLDTDACVRLLLDFGPDHNLCAIFKHTTPNGVAIDFGSQKKAAEMALSCDPLSAFGGIYGFNRKLEKETADFLINEKKMFIEVIIAPDYDEEALEILKTKKNIRILKFPHLFEQKEDFYSEPEVRGVPGGALLQDYDYGPVIKYWEVKTRRNVSEEEKFALIFAYKVCKWAKSNSAVFAKNYGSGVYTQGIGAGQQSRVHVVKLAAAKAAEFGHDTTGSVMGTDSFFPFPDGLEAAVDAGAVAIINPGGSIRDNEVIKRADELGVSLVFCGKRVFRH